MALNGGSTQQQHKALMTRGHKRIQPDEPDGEQRLAKRFDLMRLDDRGKPYISVAGAADRRLGRSSRVRDCNHMEIEDTKDRVYINDLEQEIAEVESDDEHPIFLPDIEKHLLKLPYNVLVNDADRLRMENMQLVLYSVPSSLTVPEERDNVRKAILEARERARSKGSEAEELSSQSQRDKTLYEDQLNGYMDPDAMDES